MDQTKPVLDIIWAIMSALGVSALGFTGWALQRQVSATSQNTISLAVLKQQMEHTTIAIKDLTSLQYVLNEKNAKLERDLNEAHSRIRELKAQQT